MSDAVIGLLCIVGSLVLIQTGMHIAISLILLSAVGIWAVDGFNKAGALISRAAYDNISNDVLGVIPLFVFMGLLVAAAGIGRDTFNLASWMLARVQGGLGMATVTANAIFAACTGTSIASASVFTRIAVPEMIRHGYTPRFAVGVVAGSSVLGMLIPPSLLFIIYAIISDTSIGHLFIAGIVPGIFLSLSFILLILGMSIWRRDKVFSDPSKAEKPETKISADSPWPTWFQAYVRFWISVLNFVGEFFWVWRNQWFPVVVLIFAVLGGIYLGFFTPNEAGAMGALAAIIIGLLRRELSWASFKIVVVETGRVTAAILFLIVAATIYSAMLTTTNLPAELAEWASEAKLSFAVFIIAYLILLVILGTFLDSLSILLIAVPFALEILAEYYVDAGEIPSDVKIWFGVITVIGVEVGLLTPPLGIACFVIHANLDRRDITVGDIFAGALPFTLVMLAILALIAAVPWFALALL
jgi:C4-dicarboxylate transporter DctM subunit